MKTWRLERPIQHRLIRRTGQNFCVSPDMFGSKIAVGTGVDMGAESHWLHQCRRVGAGLENENENPLGDIRKSNSIEMRRLQRLRHV